MYSMMALKMSLGQEVCLLVETLENREGLCEGSGSNLDYSFVSLFLDICFMPWYRFSPLIMFV
jgi:hypothetical protein